MKQKKSNKHMVRLIAVACICFCNSMTYGEIDGPFVNWDLDSFCGFKAFSLPKKGDDGSKTVKARKPFRKFKDVILEYAPRYLNGGKTGEMPQVCLRGVHAFCMVDGKDHMAVKREFDECCKDLARLGVVFEEMKDDGGTISRHGVAKCFRGENTEGLMMASVDVYVRGNGRDAGKKKRAFFGIRVGWERFSGSFFGFLGSFSMNAEEKSQNGPKELLETLVGSKFGEEIQPRILKSIEFAAKLNRKGADEPLVYWKRLSKPFLGMKIVKWSHSPTTKKLTMIRMENNDSEWKDWNRVSMDFKRLRRSAMRTFKIPLGGSKESGCSIVSEYEKDGFRIKVGAMQDNGVGNKKKSLRPSSLYIEFSVDGATP